MYPRPHQKNLTTKVANGITWTILFVAIIQFCFATRFGFWLFLTAMFGISSSFIVGWQVNLWAGETLLEPSLWYFAPFFLVSALIAIPLSKVT